MPKRPGSVSSWLKKKNLETELGGSDKKIMPSNTTTKTAMAMEDGSKREVIITRRDYDGDLSIPVITCPGNSVARKTGDWRLFRPAMPERGKCVRCRMCFMFCPDSCISFDPDGYPVIDYDHCKGCLICVNECKPKALVAEREGVSGKK